MVSAEKFQSNTGHFILNRVSMVLVPECYRSKDTDKDKILSKVH